eukprot:8744603-Pyramimonas_sp.AAC.1
MIRAPQWMLPPTDADTRVSWGPQVEEEEDWLFIAGEDEAADSDEEGSQKEQVRSDAVTKGGTPLIVGMLYRNESEDCIYL